MLRKAIFSKLILPILLLSLLLNIWGITWGLPSKWNPDEGTFIALKMLDQKSLNPHRFAYGSLHFYQIIIAISPVLISNNFVKLFNNSTEKKNIVLISSRLLSALLGVFIIYLIFIMTRTIFDSRAAIFSSILLTLSMGFVNISHFATSDIPSIFWFVFSCLMSVHILKDGSMKYYILAGVLQDSRLQLNTIRG